jgi:hypothetical protein
MTAALFVLKNSKDDECLKRQGRRLFEWQRHRASVEVVAPLSRSGFEK